MQSPTKTSTQVSTQANFSACGQYRYNLWQIWNPEKACVAFIGLNPSKAEVNDINPTFKRCLNYAKSWGFGGIYMVNLFAYRAATPVLLKQVSEPVGPNNDATLLSIAKLTKLQVAAWGNDGAYLQRSAAVKKLLPRLQALKVNKSGEPAHPLYLKANLRPFPLLTGLCP